MNKGIISGSFWFLFGVALLFVIGLAGLLSSFQTTSAEEGTPLPSVEASETPQKVEDRGQTFTPTQKAQFTPTVAQNTLQSPIKKLELPQLLLESAGVLTEDFESAAEWVKINGKVSQADPENKKSGQTGLKLASSPEQKSVAEKKVNWNLADSECLRFWVFRPKRNANTFEILLSTKTNFSQYFRKEVTPNPINWTLVQICREEFSNVRDADWGDPIVRIRLQVNPNDELTFDTLFTHVRPVPVVMIQFDDAKSSDYTLAFPILKKYGVRATEYVPTALVGSPETMSVAQLLDLQRNGWVIGNHTVNHILLRDLPADVQEKEIGEALQTLEQWGLRGGRYMAYPWGKYNSDTLAIMTRLGMLSGRTVSNAPDVFPQVNLFVLRTSQDVEGFGVEDIKKQVDAALLNRRILTLVFHGLTPGQTGNSDEWNEANFDKIIRYIVEKKLPTLTIDQFVKLAEGPVTVEWSGGLP